LPLDRNEEPTVDSTIDIGFGFYPRTGTVEVRGSLLVFYEGGPGYSRS
jgi:hypothetical protein